MRDRVRCIGLAPRSRILRRGHRGLSPEGLANPKSRADAARTCFGVRPRRGKVGRNDQLRHSATTARRFERTSGSGYAAAVESGYWAHSRTARRSRKRSATPHSCWDRSSKINVPAPAVDRLTTHTAESWTQRVVALAVRRRWRAERERQVAPAVPQPPGPSIGRLAASCECSRQAIGTNWMSAPV